MMPELSAHKSWFLMSKTIKTLGCFLVLLCLMAQAPSFAQWDVTDKGDDTAIDKMKGQTFDLKADTSSKVEMQADKLEYSASDNTAKGEGNVVVTSGKTTIYSDSMIMDRTRQEAIARGHMYLSSPQFQVDADEGKFNFTQGTGQFTNARIFADPFQIKGGEVSKLSDNHMAMTNGYMTTCDHDEPHFRMQSRQMDVFTGDKAIARGVTLFVGRMPLFHLPKYTMDLKNKPWFTFMPGYKKDLGAFLLTQSRIKVNDYLTSTLRVDFYERQGIGFGMDHKYRTKNTGSGLLRHYYINERSIAAKHPWESKTAPTVVNKRYLVEWRHKWDVNPTTQAIWQYFRLSDNVILPRYFEREYRRDPNVDTYFLLTKALPRGMLSFRVDKRVNRFVEAVDRTPEIKYQASSIPLGDSGFYLKNESSYVNLVRRFPSPTEDRRKTQRVDTDNEISYPTRIAFVRFTPFVGGDTTYYSRTISERTNVVRGTFKTGATLSTRFLKTFAPRRVFGRITPPFRHIIAPTVNYKYQHRPSFGPAGLNQFDAIDALDQEHRLEYVLENKLQIKRNGNVVDIIRNLTSIEQTIRQKGAKGVLGPVRNLLEVNPADWISTSVETVYDHKQNHLTETNLDLYLKHKDKFGFDIGDRYVRGGDHQLITQVAYVINPKWRFKTYHRFNASQFSLREDGYTITRDLHEWEMDLTYNQTRGQGIEFLVGFRLKAFPSQPLDLFGTTFHQRKAGSQSTIGDQ
jgi:lipopolysaccharide assembly outer membrane protein LptD (OstA)